MTMSTLQQHPQASLAQDPAHSNGDAHSGERPVHLRKIAQNLESILARDPESTVHWVSVVDEAPYGEPTRVWAHDQCALHVSLTRGHSEGMLVYVHAQTEAYKPALVPLLRIKLLCGAQRALREMASIWAYFDDSPEFV